VSTATVPINKEERLLQDIEQLVNKPLGFVYYAFDWGQPGPLEHETGPDEWQIKVLKAIEKGTLTPAQAIQIAVRSGHGIGKSALIAWIILWFMSTRPHPQVVITANTEQQLRTKTWRELSVWHNRLINKHWFKMVGDSFYHVDYPKTWAANKVPWSEHKSEAFAGTHEKHVLMIFDEASAIPTSIWETTKGAMTGKAVEGEPMTKMWIVFGNPTQNTGSFSECFKKFRHRWQTWEIDSRTTKMADHDEIAEWIEDYGEDSDFVRVRVKGMEPRAGALQFIPGDIVEAAMNRKTHEADYHFAPKIIGVDCARGGDDQTVLRFRQGIAEARRAIKLRKNDSMYIGDLIKQESDNWDADGVIIDMGSTGAAIRDYCENKLHMDNVMGVWFGGESLSDQHINKRAEMWYKMRDWLKNGGILADDSEMRDDLIGPETVYRDDGKTQLEKKKDMKKRGLASPDNADALACTFAFPVERRDRLKEAVVRMGFTKGAGDEYQRPLSRRNR
jgi:hypothetical protein